MAAAIAKTDIPGISSNQKFVLTMQNTSKTAVHLIEALRNCKNKDARELILSALEITSKEADMNLQGIPMSEGIMKMSPRSRN